MGMFKCYVGFPERGHRSFERNSPAGFFASIFRPFFATIGDSDYGYGFLVV